MQDLLAPELDLKLAMPYLEHFPENDGVPQRIPIMELPFRLGRNPGLNFTVYSSQVSKEHAEIFWAGKEYRIRDLGSTNGTFVNSKRVEEAAFRPRTARIFLNLHPSEKLDDGLIESTKALQQKLRKGQSMVLEVHEDVVADVDTLRKLRGRLKELRIEMAYDDFGAGQARLEELAEASPDYV